jgi:hypothetical protein
MALLKWFDRLLERYALWRPPASADRWVRAGDRPLLRPQNLPRSRRRLRPHATERQGDRVRQPVCAFGFETDVTLATICLP